MQVQPNEISFLQATGLKNSRLIFDGVILQLYVNDLQLDNGMLVERELIHHQPGVAVLAITSEDKVVLVKQYRPAVNRYVYEIPAGMLDKGDSHHPLAGAKRELEEETAYQGQTWRELWRFYVSPGFLNEEIIVYEARDLVKIDNPLPQDDDEEIELFELDRQTVREMWQRGEFVDAKTLLALQHWLTGGV